MANTDMPTKRTLCWAYKDKYFNFQIRHGEKDPNYTLKTMKHKIYFLSISNLGSTLPSKSSKGKQLVPSVSMAQNRK